MNEWLEDQRDIFLCAVFDRQYATAETALMKIYHEAVSGSDLTEYHQKILNQVLVIFKRFRKELTAGCSERIPAAARAIKGHLASLAKKARTAGPSRIDYPRYKALLAIPDSLSRVLTGTVISFQLTSGCSHYCRRCNEWALPGIRKHFSYSAVRQIIQELSDAGNSGFALYAASDPLDWEDGDHDIRHILEFMTDNKIHPEFGLLTKIPKKKEPLFIHLVQQETDMAVSVTNRNRNRIKKLEAFFPALEKQHDSDDLMIPACRDEDFVTVKSSITDTYGTEISPDGAFIIIPTLTSALNPFGHKKIPVTRHTSFFLQRKTGRQALGVEYFKPLEAVSPDGKAFRLLHLLDTQIETLLLDNGSNTLNVPGMTNIREFFDLFKTGTMVQRRNLLPTIIKKLKSSRKHCPDYKDRIRAWAAFCKPGPVMAAKWYAVSFFLEAIRSFSEQHPVRARLICHLRKTYIARLNREFSSLSPGADIKTLLADPCLDSFLLFEYLKFKPLASGDLPAITRFIRNHPAAFDTVSGRFGPAGPH